MSSQCRLSITASARINRNTYAVPSHTRQKGLDVLGKNMDRKTAVLEKAKGQINVAET